MAAARTRILFGDDTDLLAHARMDIVARADLDVVMAGTTQEAIEAAISSPRPHVAILPVSAELDGMDVCRKLKTASPGVGVILALPPANIAQRDECFVAGADDVVFAPVTADMLAGRIAARLGGAFRNAPRAAVEMVVHLQGSTNGPVIECRSKEISREALLLALPQGLGVPPPGTLVRAIFTLYEGGTLSLWARFAPSDQPAFAAVRFVGVTDPELRSLDYFVDFYRKSATARAAVDEVTNDQIRAAAEEITTSTVTGGPATPAKTNTGVPVEDLRPSDATLHQLVDSDLDAVAAAGARAASGRENTLPPLGFSVLRFKAIVAKLTPSEISALRGTTMYNDILADLRLCSGAKLRLFEMTAQLKTAKGSVTPLVAERAALAAIAEAQLIHKRLEAALEARMKAGNTDAVRDLGVINSGLVNACVDLKRTLDGEILKKQTVAPAPTPAAVAGPVKYDKPAREEPVAPPVPAEAKAASSGIGRRIALGVLLVAGLGAAAWQNRFLFLPRPPNVYVATSFARSVGAIHVLLDTTRGDEIACLVDDSWNSAPESDRQALLADLRTRAPETAKTIGVYKPTGERIVSEPAHSPTPDTSLVPSPPG